MPKISVVMSVYNGEPYLDAAVKSILQQTYGDFEFIIVDDGSKDRSADIVKEYSDPRIVLLSQENQGIAAALNRGLSVAKGVYIARQDADDISMPDRFLAQVEYLDRHPDVAVLGTGALIIDSNGRVFDQFSPFTGHDRLVAELQRGVCPIMHGSVMARRDAILEAGAYRPVFERIQDVELWLRLSARYRLANLRAIHYQYRKHDRSITREACLDLRIRAFAETGRLAPDTSPDEWLRFKHEFDANFSGSKWERAFDAETYLREARIALSRGDAACAISCGLKALKRYPRIAAELPARIARRVWRSCLPVV